MAFDHVDEDGSGGLDQEELQEVMSDVAVKMGVPAPSQDDLDAILRELDDNFDG